MNNLNSGQLRKLNVTRQLPQIESQPTSTSSHRAMVNKTNSVNPIKLIMSPTPKRRKFPLRFTITNLFGYRENRDNDKILKYNEQIGF